MEKKLKNTESKMSIVSEDILSILQKDIAEIKVALLGNEYNPAGGLLCRTSELERELAKLKNRYEKIMWTVGAASIIIAAIFNIVVQVWDKLVIK
jgi:hypothetical protein